MQNQIYQNNDQSAQHISCGYNPNFAQNNMNVQQYNSYNQQNYGQYTNNTLQYTQYSAPQVPQMRCPRCGSLAVFSQIMQEQQGSNSVTKTKSVYKQKKHGLFWWLFIGWWWWIVDIFLWLLAFPFRFAFALFRKKKYTKKEISKTTSRNQIAYKKVCTCQQCGNVWMQTV